MKIGVIFCIYNCEDYVDRCLTPWFELKDDHDFIFTVTSGRFKDYELLGIPNRNQFTLKKLVEWDFDFMSITGGNKLLDEDSSRNRCLDFLKPHGCDLIWLVDGDEFYTKDQIRNTIHFIESTPEIESFSLYLKNYTIKYPLFTGTWNRPTIFRNRKWGGIGRFYFDSYFVYSDNKEGVKNVFDLEIRPIPRKICFLEHNSWLPTQATKDKIKYQNLRYSGINHDIPEGCRCSFEWGEEGLKFSPSFWECRKLQIPILCEFPSEISNPSFQVNFERSHKKITISSDERFESLNVQIFELSNENPLGGFEIIELNPDVNFWFIPGDNRDYEAESNFYGMKVKIFQNSTLIHEVNLHTKI